MAWPKGLSRKKDIPTADPSKFPISPTGQVVAPKPKTFEVGQWYRYTGDDEVVLLDGGRLALWSILRFQVAKVATIGLAVRIEGGLYEFVPHPKIEDFEAVKAPNY